VIDTLRSEWIKVRTVRMNWVLGLIAVAFPLIVSALTAALADERDLDGEELLGVVTGTGVVSAMLLGTIAAAGIASEFGTGTIRPTFAATPRRSRVVAAKAVVAAAFSAAAGLAIVIASFLVASVIAESRDTSVSLSDVDAGIAPIVGEVVLFALLGLLGLALGLITRNAPSAVVTLLLWPLVAENLIIGLLSVAGVDRAARFMPYISGIQLANPEAGQDPELLGRVAGGAYFGAVVLVLLVIGALLTERRDA
jgi:ABC-2 type transport system permease protein